MKRRRSGRVTRSFQTGSKTFFVVVVRVCARTTAVGDGRFGDGRRVVRNGSKSSLQPPTRGGGHARRDDGAERRIGRGHDAILGGSESETKRSRRENEKKK